MSVYLDASILVSLFIIDSQSARADRLLRSGPGAIVVSDFAAAEFAAVVGRKTRTGDLDADERDAVFADFDIWTRQTARIAETTANDIATAISFLRRRDLTLRAPDAINIALSLRLGTVLATFDERMARDARAVGANTAVV
ncbi:MAG TPA: type II toxin-antitoxin system VapC family toxin [Bauldia sp.]|nr:type II toxin-antitoxin system VapC family toxin [Bauldia sp.]